VSLEYLSAGCRYTTNRLAEPLSKLACYEYWRTERAYLPEAAVLTLDHLYGALAFLDTHIEAIEREIFLRTADLFRADVDLSFWDTTSVSFEVDDDDVSTLFRTTHLMGF
jgi:hypothetical protein